MAAFDAALVINIGAAALFALVGVGILVVGRRSRRGRLVGGIALAFGLTYVFQNLLLGRKDWVSIAAVDLPFLITAALAVALAHDLLHGLPRRTRLAYWGMTLLAIALLATDVVSFVQSLVPGLVGGGVVATVGACFSIGAPVVLFVLLGAIGLRFRSADVDAGERTALAGLALAFGPFAVFLLIAGVLFGYRHVVDSPSPIVDAITLALAVACLPAIAPFAATSPRAGAGLARAVFPALLAAGVLALVAAAVDSRQFNSYWGLYGILRTIGAVFLVNAVLRHDLLGVRLPRIAVKRGAMATAALASLFIVAQVAQNFFAAQYGLLMGGVVAGAVVFAASPIQRAMERKSAGDVPVGIRDGRQPASRDDGRQAAAEASFTLALRRFYVDGTVSPDEELALAHLADELGLTTRGATELRQRVLAERRKR